MSYFCVQGNRNFRLLSKSIKFTESTMTRCNWNSSQESYLCPIHRLPDNQKSIISQNSIYFDSHFVLIGVRLPSTLNPEAFSIDHTCDMEQCQILKCQGLFLKNSREKFPVKDHIYIFLRIFKFGMKIKPVGDLVKQTRTIKPHCIVFYNHHGCFPVS